MISSGDWLHAYKDSILPAPVVRTWLPCQAAVPGYRIGGGFRAVVAGARRTSCSAGSPAAMRNTRWQGGSEQGYCEHLQAAGLTPTTIQGVGVDNAAVAETLAAMRAGAPVIVQGALKAGRWCGRADVLRRVEVPSRLGPWSYEALDTKLARETKAGAVLQLCLYSDLLAETQGVMPERASVVAPWTDYVPQVFRVSDFAAYYRRVKHSLEQALSGERVETPYPDPIEYCDVCRWRLRCDSRRREDDHCASWRESRRLRSTSCTAVT